MLTARPHHPGCHLSSVTAPWVPPQRCHSTLGATSAWPQHPQVPPHQPGHRHPTGTAVAFPARSSQALPPRTAPPFHLPISDPSTQKSTLGCRAHITDPQLPSRSQEGTRQHPQPLVHELPRMGPAPESGALQGAGALQSAGALQGEGVLHKAFQTARIGPKVPILFPCKAKPSKLLWNCTFRAAQLRRSPAAPWQYTQASLTLIISPLNFSSIKPNPPAHAGGLRGVPSALPSASAHWFLILGPAGCSHQGQDCAPSSSSHTALSNVTAPCTIALQFLVQMFWNRMAEALWHFNASLMSVIYPAQNIFFFSPGHSHA